MVYLPHWHRAGIKQISDLFDEHENCFMPFLSLRNKYSLNCNFLQYYSLLSAIPQSWKKILRINSGESTTPPPPIGTITCKMLYDKLLTLENLPPPTAEKKLLSYGIAKSIPSDSQNISHLFISCPQASSFWYKFQSWYSTVSKASLLLSEPEVLFGITRPCAYRLTLNHLIILGKYLLYINALNNIRFVFSDFISFVHDKIEIEKYIAGMSNSERKFQQKWKFLLTI